MSQLSAHDLGLWRGDRCLCRGLSFTLESGSILQLAGPNGSGKTSLMRAVAGVGRVDEGEIRWDGQAIRRSETYRDSLAYLGHHNGLKQHLSPIENYVFYQSIAEYSSETGAKEALDSFGLSGEVQDRPTGLLSMGQKRRAALARLLAVKARLWLLDEPLTSLDVDGIAFMTGLLARHLKEGGMALLATHQAIALDGIRLNKLELGVTA